MFRAVLVSPSDIAAIVQQVRRSTVTPSTTPSTTPPPPPTTSSTRQVQSMSPSVIALGPLQLAYVARIAFGGHNNDRVAYLADSIPASLPTPPPVLTFTAQLRNDGWNVWVASNHSLVVSFPTAEVLVPHPALVKDAWEAARLPARLQLPVPTAPSLKAGWLRRHGRMVVPAPVHAASSAATTLCPLPSDVPPGGQVSVSCTVPWPTVQVPADTPAGSGTVLVTVRYQLAALKAAGGVAYTFDANGNIPWETVVAVGA